MDAFQTAKIQKAARQRRSRRPAKNPMQRLQLPKKGGGKRSPKLVPQSRRPPEATDAMRNGIMDATTCKTNGTNRGWFVAGTIRISPKPSLQAAVEPEIDRFVAESKTTMHLIASHSLVEDETKSDESRLAGGGMHAVKHQLTTVQPSRSQTPMENVPTAAQKSEPEHHCQRCVVCERTFCERANHGANAMVLAFSFRVGVSVSVDMVDLFGIPCRCFHVPNREGREERDVSAFVAGSA